MNVIRQTKDHATEKCAVSSSRRRSRKCKHLFTQSTGKNKKVIPTFPVSSAPRKQLIYGHVECMTWYDASIHLHTIRRKTFQLWFSISATCLAACYRVL